MGATLTGNGHRANRDVRSRELAERQFAPAITTRECHLEQLDLSLGDSVAVSHFAPPWGEGTTERRHHRVLGMTINPGARSVKCIIRDEREAMLQGTWLRFFFMDQSDYGSGMFSVMPHPGFSYWTGGCTMAEDPADGVVQRQLSKPYSRGGLRGAVRINPTESGLLVERWAFETMKRNGYVAGVTGLVAYAPGGAPSTFAAQPAPPINLLFRWTLPDDTGTWISQCIEITAAPASPTGGGYSHPASLTVNTGVVTCLTIDHNDDAGASLYYRLQRAIDGFYWNNSSAAWGAGVTDNEMPIVTDRWERYVSKPIASPAGNTTYTLTLLQLTGGTVSRKNRVACVNLNYWPWAHSRVVTDTNSTADPNPYAAATTSSHDQLSISNKTLIPGSGIGSVLRHKRGTFLARFRRNWMGPSEAFDQRANATGTLMVLPGVLQVFHDGPNNRWGCSRVDGSGTPVTIYNSEIGLLAGAQVDLVVVRWASPTSAGGELDSKYGSAGAGTEQNFDLTVISGPRPWTVANGVNASAPLGADNSTIQIGNDDSGNGIDSAIEIIGFTDYVLSDAEILSFAGVTVLSQF